MISIIIPVLNEANSITALLNHLLYNASGQVKEIIISDGGSTDGTLRLLEAFNAKESGIKISIANSLKGRARQMNTGAKQARGEVLYFLHADSFPPKNFDTLIMEQVRNCSPAGCFRMRFDNEHWWLRLAGWLTQFSWRACRGGDQSQFITRSLFEEIGGYDESYSIYEDNMLINELYARKHYVVIQSWLTSSARLYEEKGIWNLQYHFWTIYVKKWFGAGPDELLDYYIKNIKQDRRPQAPKKRIKESKPVYVK